MKLGEAIYKTQQTEQQAEQQAEPSKKEGDSKDNVVDAEYEDVTK
jgi:hypothetical protein